MNFSRKEFACKCGCGFDTIDYELLEVLKDIRIYYGVPVLINSGCRCVSHNHSVGGSPHSQHVLGRACDFVVKGIDADEVADYLESKYQGKFGIGRYNGRTHIDTRSNGPARWDKR